MITGILFFPERELLIFNLAVCLWNKGSSEKLNTIIPIVHIVILENYFAKFCEI